MNAVQDLLDKLKKEEENMKWYEKVWDYIRWNIIDSLVDIFHPVYNWYRLNRLCQRIFRGWDDSDLWSLDYVFAEWILKNCHPWLTKNAIIAFEYILDEDKDYKDNDNMDEYRKYYKDTQKKIQIGIKEFNNSLFINKYFAGMVAKWWIPRLIEFVKTVHGWPTQMATYRHINFEKLNEEEENKYDKMSLDTWKRIVYDKILFAFQLINLKKLNCYHEYSSYESMHIKKGLSYFSKYLQSLWN